MRNAAWGFLLIAGLLEIAWTIGLKYTEGWTRLVPSIFTAIAMACSFFLLSTAIRTLPIGTAYAVWTGIGIVGATLFGVFFLKEPANLSRILFITLILIGIVGLKLSTRESL